MGILDKVSSETSKLGNSRRLILSRAAILIFGAIPALFPAYLAVLGIAVFLAAAVETPLAGLLALWPFAGLYGVTALWMTVFGQANRTVALGLTVGILAMSPMSVTVFLEPGSDFLFNFMFLGPVATAAVLLFQLVRAGVLSVSRDTKPTGSTQELAWASSRSAAETDDETARPWSKPSLPALAFVIAVIVITYVLIQSMSPDDRVGPWLKGENGHDSVDELWLSTSGLLVQLCIPRST